MRDEPIAFFFADGRVVSREALPSQQATLFDVRRPTTFNLSSGPYREVTPHRFEAYDFATLTPRRRFRCFVEAGVDDAFRERIAAGADAADAVGKLASALEERERR